MIVDNSVYGNKIYLQTDNNFFLKHTMTKNKRKKLPDREQQSPNANSGILLWKTLPSKFVVYIINISGQKL